MRINARAVLDPTKQVGFAIPKGQGFLCLQVLEGFRPNMGKQLESLQKRQRAKFEDAKDRWSSTPPAERGQEPTYQDGLLDLELELTIHFRRRSVDQNALSWTLYEIEASWINGNVLYANGYWSNRLPGHIVTPEMVHDDDCEVYCEKRKWRILRVDKFKFSRAMEYGEIGRVKTVKDVDGEPEKLDVEVWKTTSFLDTKEMSEWTKRQIDRIVDNGLLKCDEDRFLGIKQDLEDIMKGKRKRKKQ